MALPSSMKKTAALLLLITVTIFLYSPAFYADYVNWDDKAHILDNPLIKNGGSSFYLKVFLTEDTVNKTYIPLTAVSFYIEKQLFGFIPLYSHLINLILHLSNVILIIFLGQLLGLSFLASYVAAFLFAIHPMHVESVAWVTERKDVLYSFFYLLSLILYCRFQDTGRGAFYLLALSMAVLSVFSKPMALSLPLVLVLIDYIRSRHLGWEAFLEKVPFAAAVLMIAGVSCLLNVRPIEFSFPSSLLIWIWTAFFYLKMFLIPIGLSPLYGLPAPISIINPEYWGALLGIVVLILMLVKQRQSRWVIFAFAFYGLSTFFLWRFDIFDHSIVADRFMYLPSMGICFLIGLVLEGMLSGYRPFIATGVVFLVSLVFAGLCITTYRQLGYWQNSWRLWSRVLELRPGLYFAHFTRAQAVSDKQLYKKIAPDFEKFVYSRLAFPPKTSRQVALVQGKLRYFEVFFALRWFRYELSRPLWGRSHFQEIPIDRTYSGYINQLLLIGNYKKALAYTAKKSLRYPLKAQDFIVMGRCYTNLGFYSKAFESLSRAIEQEPKNYDAYLARGAVSVLMGDIEKAYDDVGRLFKIDPMLSGGYDLLFNIYLTMNELGEAKKVLDKEIVLWPNDPQVFRHSRLYVGKTGDIQ